MARWSRWAAVGLVASAIACGRGADPRVEAWTDEQWQAVATSAFSIEGKRDGATTVATARCTLASQQRLELKLEIVYDPIPELRSGSWTSSGGTSGSVRAESVQFAGGQGEGPSVGGVFVLETDGTPSYRVRLPLSAVATPRWKPE